MAFLFLNGALGENRTRISSSGGLRPIHWTTNTFIKFYLTTAYLNMSSFISNTIREGVKFSSTNSLKFFTISS